MRHRKASRRFAHATISRTRVSLLGEKREHFRFVLSFYYSPFSFDHGCEFFFSLTPRHWRPSRHVSPHLCSTEPRERKGDGESE